MADARQTMALVEMLPCLMNDYSVAVLYGI